MDVITEIPKIIKAALVALFAWIRYRRKSVETQQYTRELEYSESRDIDGGHYRMHIKENIRFRRKK